MSYKPESKGFSADAKDYNDENRVPLAKADSKSMKATDDEEEIFISDYKSGRDDMGSKMADMDVPKIEILSIKVQPKEICPVNARLSLRMTFELDRDVVAAYWQIRFLVDSAHSRIIKILGDTPVEDYPDGESEMHFETDAIDISGIEPSALANSGLLMAVFMVNGEEVANVNMVVQVFKKDDIFVREILSPLE